MPTLAEYFEIEARAQLGRLDEVLSDAEPDLQALQRAARELRGAAQMARVEPVQRVALALEQAARSLGSTSGWSEAALASARAAVDDLRTLIERTEPEHALQARVQANLDRWRDAGIELPVPGGTARPAPSGGAFRAYVADEVEGIAATLVGAVRELGADGMNREPLKSVLRRQRALLGSARLDDIPVIAEILRAVEDLTRVIVRLDVAVKQEWLDIFRIAHDGLRTTVATLRQDQNPPPSTALARLRHMRQELIDRYGTGEPVNADAPAPEGLPAARPAGAAAGAVEGEGEEAVPIALLEYRGEAALRRARELRGALQAAGAGEAELRAAVDELVDLVRLARE